MDNGYAGCAGEGALPTAVGRDQVPPRQLKRAVRPVGDKFRCEELWAAILTDQDTIEFHGDKLLKTVRLAT